MNVLSGREKNLINMHNLIHNSSLLIAYSIVS